jgi:regulator of protease activity HflC (stomatin/prohibitin superfamily)
MNVSDTRHFVGAKRFVGLLFASGASCAAIGLFMISPLWSGFVLGLLREADRRNLPLAGCSLLLAAAGLIAAGLVSRARRRRAAANQNAPERPVHSLSRTAERKTGIRRRQLLARLWVADEARVAHWPQVAVTAAISAIATVGVMMAWRLGPSPAPSSQFQLIIGGGLVLACFPLLVLERFYAGLEPTILPEAASIKWLLRVPLAGFVGIGTATILLSLGFSWSLRIEQALAILIFLVSSELLLRSAATLFLPLPQIEQVKSIADSSVAHVLRFGRPSFSSMAGTIEKQFGVDLSRSWALFFIRRAAAPVLLGLGVFAWLLTGVTSLRLNERAIYERGGVPVEVLGPGLHAGLPWPLGNMRRIEFGTIHEIPIFFSTDAAPAGAGTASEAVEPQKHFGAEDVPLPSADRLWNGSHPSEATYLVASESNGQQSFQIIDIDLRLTYRIGLSPAAAREAAYNVADPERNIRALAGQLLARYFAGHTLMGVIGENRDALGAELQSTLQGELDRLETGVELVAVIVEAVHPPAGAANAYHEVQAAEIKAHTAIATEQASAVQTEKEAQMTATAARNEAAAKAAETVKAADAASQLFDAEKTAYARSGPAFLLERRFERLANKFSTGKSIIVDHRLTGIEAPTIDLRSFSVTTEGEIRGAIEKD